jgi:hypothetical protein
MNLFILIAATPVWGMESSRALQPLNASPKASPIKEKKIRLTSNFKENYPDLFKKAHEDESLSTFTSEKFVLSEKKAIAAMNAAKERGANIYLTVGSHAQNKPAEYQTTTFKRDPNIHGKVTVGLDQSPSKQTPKKGILLFGSANITNQTWQHRPRKPGAQFNFESGVAIENDMDIIPAAYKMIKNQSPMKPTSEKTTLANTPEKISIFSSKDTNLNKSLGARFTNPQIKKVSARSMTFNDEEVADALSAMGQNAEIIVDSSALTSTGTPLLQKMHDAHVKVNVFYPKEGSRAKQHAKDVILEYKDPNKTTYISSTANITKEGDTQRNYQLYVPNNKQIIADAQEDFEKVKQSTISLPKALGLQEQAKERKLKRKLQKTKTKQATKKQKR